VRRVRVLLSSHIAYITAVNATATATPPKFRCVLAIAPEWLVVEGLTDDELDDAAPPVNVGVDVAVPASVGIVVGTPVVGIEAAPVAPGIFADGRGDCKRTEGVSYHILYHYRCIISRVEMLKGK
jgi:hypothetical protein